MNAPVRRIRYPILIAIAAAIPALAHAQSGVKPGEEWLILRVGAVSGTYDTYTRFDGTTSSGTGINLEDNLGLNGDKSTFVLGGTWRPFERHRFDGLYDSVKRSASRTTERQFVIDGTVVPAGTVLSAEQETKLGYLGYRYSFHKKPDMEISAGLGLYGGNVKFKFDANQPVVGIDKSTTLPLPVLTLNGDFYLTENMTLSANLRGLKVKIGDVDGSVLQYGLAAEYYFTKNFGVGASLERIDIEADVTKSSFRGAVEFKATSGRLYLSARF
jgi:hypothetical protein